MVAPRLLLASGSPRRHELLSLTGLVFRVINVDINESSTSGEMPAQYVARLAMKKNEEACLFARQDEWIVTADTTVADGNNLLGKPSDDKSAFAMLSQLRNRTHQVYTALVIKQPHSNLAESELCISNVPMRDYSDAEIKTYIASGDPLDKAGAYGIQHKDFSPVKDFKGCMASVMGLPLCHLARNLIKHKVQFSVEIQKVCQNHLRFHCEIFSKILRGQEIG
jgi:MAF protein